MLVGVQVPPRVLINVKYLIDIWCYQLFCLTLQQIIKDMEKRKMSEDELRWQSEEDARTLERYQAILKDKSRLDRAMKVAAKTVDDLQERAKALNKSLTGLKKK